MQVALGEPPSQSGPLPLPLPLPPLNGDIVESDVSKTVSAESAETLNIKPPDNPRTDNADKTFFLSMTTTPLYLLNVCICMLFDTDV